MCLSGFESGVQTSHLVIDRFVLVITVLRLSIISTFRSVTFPKCFLTILAPSSSKNSNSTLPFPPTRRSCACGSRPGARTRSGRTSMRSAIPSAAIASTAPPRARAALASSLTPRTSSWRSRSAARRSRRTRRCRMTSRARSRSRAAAEAGLVYHVRDKDIRPARRDAVCVLPGHPCPGPQGTGRAAPPDTFIREQHRGSARNQGAPGGRRSVRPPDAPLEPEDAAIHL